MFFHFLAFFSTSKFLKDRQLVISMDGTWPDTPLLAEAAAFIADANGEAYWSFLRGLQKADVIPTSLDQIRQYSLDYLSDELRALLDLALRTRAYSPRIEMFRQIARNYSSDANSPFSLVAGRAYPTVAALESALSSGVRSRPVVYPFEPRHGASRDTAIIYCPPSDPELFRFLDLIESYEEYYSFVLRPIGQTSDAPVRFRGYGFEVRPFNYSMIYQNMSFLDMEIEKGGL